MSSSIHIDNKKKDILVLVRGPTQGLGKNRYHSMSKEKKQKLKEYQKQRYQKAKEPKNNNE